MQCIFLTADLMFSTRVLGAAQASGIPLKIVHAAGDLAKHLAADTRLVIVDLTMPQLRLGDVVENIRREAPAASIVAFGPHIDEQSLAAARAAGCNVLTRGQFHQSYAELLNSTANQC